MPFLETDPLPAAVTQARRGQNGLGQGLAGVQSPLYLLLFLLEEMAHACLKLGRLHLLRPMAVSGGQGALGEEIGVVFKAIDPPVPGSCTRSH